MFFWEFIKSELNRCIFKVCSEFGALLRYLELVTTLAESFILNSRCLVMNSDVCEESG